MGNEIHTLESIWHVLVEVTIKSGCMHRSHWYEALKPHTFGIMFSLICCGKHIEYGAKMITQTTVQTLNIFQISPQGSLQFTADNEVGGKHNQHHPNVRPLRCMSAFHLSMPVPTLQHVALHTTPKHFRCRKLLFSYTVLFQFTKFHPRMRLQMQ